MYITTAGNKLFGLKIAVIQCLESMAYQKKANIGKAALPVSEMIGNKWKAEDGFNGDRRATDEFQ